MGETCRTVEALRKRVVRVLAFDVTRSLRHKNPASQRRPIWSVHSHDIGDSPVNASIFLNSLKLCVRMAS